MGHKFKIAAIVSAAVLGIAVVIAIPAFLAFQNRDYSGRFTLQKEIRYASEYDLKPGETKGGVLNRWGIKKTDDDGTVSLFISNKMKRTDELDYMAFDIFDSTPEAREEYDNLYARFSEYKSDEGSNWFCYWEPGVCDALVERIYLVEGNVLISAEVNCISCWAEERYPEDGVTFETNPYVNDNHTLKNYIIDNASDIREYLLHDVLGY